MNTNLNSTSNPEFNANQGVYVVIPKNLDGWDREKDMLEGPAVSPSGGTIMINYGSPRFLESINVLDKDDPEDSALIREFNENNVLLKVISIPTEGDGQIETIDLNTADVTRLEVTYHEDMAIGNIKCGSESTRTSGSSECPDLDGLKNGQIIKNHVLNLSNASRVVSADNNHKTRLAALRDEKDIKTR